MVQSNFYIAKEVFLLNLDTMKKCLDLVEFKLGKNSEDFKFMKKHIMNYYYGTLKRFFEKLLKKGLFEKCSCGANLRQGYADCSECGGSGYKDKKR